MKGKIVTALLAVFIFFLAPAKVYAVCPVCIVAVGAGVGLSRWLGISDLITGLWLGGLLLASSLWTDTFLKKRKIKFALSKLILTILFYFMAFIPLHASKIIGHPLNRIFGIDKLFFGSLFGTFLFCLSVFADKFVRIKNDGKVKFYYQKVIIPVSVLLIVSIIFYLAKI